MAEMTFAAWMAVASAVASAVTMAVSLSQGKPNINSADQGVLLSKKGVDNPRLVAFGNCLIPASVTYKNIRNQDRKWMIQVHSLGHGVFRKVKQVYIDEQPIFGETGNDLAEQWHTSPIDGFRNVQVGIRRGNYNNQTWPQIVANGDGEWTDAMKGHSIASLQFLIERPDTRGAKDQEYRIMGTQFGSSALVEGIAVVDPTLDPMLLGIHDVSKRVWMNGTKEAYRNPVLQLLNYLLDPMYGAGLKPSMINIQTFINSMNWCYQNGMVGDGYINQNDTYQKIIEGFANSWGGNIYLENGKICCVPETVAPVVETINESDLIGNLSVSNDRGDYVNLVKVEWQDKDTQYNKNTFIIPNNIQTDQTIQEDGKVFYTSIEVPMSTDIEYIKRFANRELKRSRLCRKQAVFIINNLDKHLKINDVFIINNELYQLDSNTKWRVQKIESSLDDKVIQSKITAIQYDSRVYDTSDSKDSVVGGDLGRPNLNILPPTDLKFVQNTTTDIGSGLFSFESQYFGEQTFRIQYKLSSSYTWIQYGEFPFDNVMITGLQSGTNYDFRVQCAATIGSSRWSELKNQRVNKNISLPAVKNLVGNFTSANAVWTWDAINEPIVNNSVVANTYTNLSELVHYYEVSILHGITTKKTYRTTTPNFTYLFDENSKNGLSRDVTVRITPVSIYGDRGQETSLKLFNEPMGQPSSVLVESQLVNLTVSWLNPSNLIADYDSTDIWITDTKVAPTAADFVATSDIGSWTAVRQSGKKKGWVYVAHRDVFGHPAIPVYSAPIYFEETSIDDLITGSEFESNFDELEKTVTDNKVLQEEIRQDVDKNKAESDAAFNKNNADIAKAKEDIVKNASDIVESNQKIATNTASINTNAQAITGVKGDMATMETRLQAGIDTNKANITKNATAIAATDKNLAEYKISVSTEFGKTNGRIDTVQNSVSTLDGTVTTLSTKVDANYTDLNNKNTATNARINTQATAIADQSKALTTLDQKLTARINTNAAGIETNRLAIVDDKKALADFKISVNTEFGKTNGNVTQLSNSLSTLDGTVASLTTEVRANKTSQDGLNKSMDAAIKSNQVAITDTNKALAQTETRLQTGIDTNKASITQISQAQVGTDGKVSAIYGLKVDANGKVAGMTLGATDKGSTVDFLADTFRIANTSIGTPVTAFEVRDGKVMMRNVLIGDLTSTNIRTSSLTGRELMATSVIRAGIGATSATMSGEDPKWRIWAGQDGAEGAPFRVDKDGILYSRGGVFDGTIYARSGEFTGAIIAKSGRIDGPLLLQNGSYISGNIAVDHFISGAGGRFVVQQNGDMSCQYANISGGFFRGTTFIENLQGDVYTKTFYSLPIQKGSFVPGGGDQRNFALFQVNSATFDRSMFFSRIDVPYAIYDNSGLIQCYYQCEGKAPVWIQNYQSTSGQPHDIVDFRVRLPKGSTYVRFFVVSTSRTLMNRAAPCNGTVELSKWSDTNVVTSSGV